MVQQGFSNVQSPRPCILLNRVSDLDEEGRLLGDDASRTPEERQARAMASTTALRRDLAPVVSVRVVQETGGCTQQVIRNRCFDFVVI